MGYLNRDISWLAFNQRVVDEANKSIPKAEKVLFHGISFSNLDEFLMVRYPATVEENDDNDDLLREFKHAVINHHGLLNERFAEFNKKQQIVVPADKVDNTKWVTTYFEQNIFPALQPVTFDKMRPFEPHRGLNIFVECYDGQEDEVTYNTIEIPNTLPRFIRTPDKKHYIAIEDIIAANIKKMFRERKVKVVCPFSVLRSAEVFIQATGYVDQYKLIEKTLHEREKSWITRLEIGSMDKKIIKKIRSLIPTDPNTLVFPSRIVNLADLKVVDGEIFSGKDEIRKLKGTNPFPAENIFNHIKKEDRLVFHPYESYADSVVRFIDDAAEDDKVVSIKISLYRVASKSKIIEALLKAADNGKLVTVLVELKARVDEHHNIKISTILKEGGIRLVYSPPDLKTHAKVCLVTRQEKKGLRIYSHVGTGNYNESNAKTYTDYSYFTADQDIGNDLTKFFNLLTSDQGKFKSQKILYAPYNLRSEISDNIDKEIKRAKANKKAKIIFKCNALTDDKIADKLVEAAKAGVRVTLIVRGSCIIKPCKNLSIYSIVGRFLEHSRVYCFGDGADTKVYIGSNDIMYRNLNLRNELMILIKNPDIKKRIRHHLALHMQDNVNRRKILPGYKYRDIKPKEDQKLINSQEKLIKEAKKRAL